MKKRLKSLYLAPAFTVIKVEHVTSLLSGSNETIIDGGEIEWDAPIAPDVWDLDMDQLQIFN